MIDLCDYAQLTALLARHGFRFDKSKGQNFLIDASVPEAIAESCPTGPDYGIVEIGPGVGCLTQQLAARAQKILAYEVDHRLKPVLNETLAEHTNVELLFTDVMRADLNADIRAHLTGLRPVVCANLPYNITTPVLTKLYEARCFEQILVMVQKEVADRIAAKPSTPDYGSFSVFSQWYCVPEILFTVEPECFCPAPKVRSAVVRLTVRDEAPFSVPPAEYFRVVRAAFGQRRKTLSNALGSVFGKETASLAIRACGLDEKIRGENLSPAQFAVVTEELTKLTATH